MKKALDEMEKTIKMRSQAFGFRGAVLLLAIWTMYESYLVLFTPAERLNIIPSLILTISLCVQYFSELILKRKMIAGDEEYREPNKVVLTIIAIIALAAIIITIGSFFILNRN